MSLKKALFGSSVKPEQIGSNSKKKIFQKLHPIKITYNLNTDDMVFKI